MATTYEPIGTQTLGTAAASITFSSIPATYTDLRLILTGTPSVDGSNFYMQFNGITTTTYSSTILYGNHGPAVGTFTLTSQPQFWLGFESSNTLDSTVDINIFSYAGSTNKTIFTAESSDTNIVGQISLTSGLWRSTAAITSIRLFVYNSGNYNAGTVATLYGIKAA
jgi:hypothetical protein